MNFFKIISSTKSKKKVTETEKNKFPSLSLSLSPSFLRLHKAGLTLVETLVVLVIMSILVGIAYSQLRTPNEKIACKEIYSDMQMKKMQAVSTGVNQESDVDAVLSSVDDVDVPGEVSYLTSAPTNVPTGWSAFPSGGIDFGGSSKKIYFSAKGMAVDSSGNSTSGSVYLYDVNNTSRLCAVSVLSTGLVKMSASSDGGSSWN